MKLPLVLLAALFITATASAADVPALRADHTETVEKELVKVEHNWNEAFKNRDKAALQAICGQDFLLTNDDGTVIGRTTFIGDALTKLKVVNYTVSEVTAHSYGDTGIVTGLWKGTISVDDHLTEATERFTDTFVRRDNHWWAVAGQMTRVTQDGAAE